MAHFFAALLALLQPAPPAVATFDPRWSVAFESAPATAPGFDATAAYVPLNAGQLVAVNSNAVRSSGAWMCLRR